MIQYKLIDTNPAFRWAKFGDDMYYVNHWHEELFQQYLKEQADPDWLDKHDLGIVAVRI